MRIPKLLLMGSIFLSSISLKAKECAVPQCSQEIYEFAQKIIEEKNFNPDSKIVGKCIKSKEAACESIFRTEYTDPHGIPMTCNLVISHESENFQFQAFDYELCKIDTTKESANFK